MRLWGAWLGEGDRAGAAWSGVEYAWQTLDSLALFARPGDRFYIVAHGLVRGYAPIDRVEQRGDWHHIIRRGGAVACSIRERVAGFRGLRKRWWRLEDEVEFCDWETDGVRAGSRDLFPRRGGGTGDLFESL